MRAWSIVLYASLWVFGLVYLCHKIEINPAFSTDDPFLSTVPVYTMWHELKKNN